MPVQLRTRIARWLLKRRTLPVDVDLGADDRWRWYAYAPWLGNDLIAQPPLRGYASEDIARKMAVEVLADGWDIQFVPLSTWREALASEEAT